MTMARLLNRTISGSVSLSLRASRPRAGQQARTAGLELRINKVGAGSRDPEWPATRAREDTEQGQTGRVGSLLLVLAAIIHEQSRSLKLVTACHCARLAQPLLLSDHNLFVTVTSTSIPCPRIISITLLEIVVTPVPPAFFNPLIPPHM